MNLKDMPTNRILLLGTCLFFVVAHDSAEVWANRDLFELDAEGHPLVVAGFSGLFFRDRDAGATRSIAGMCWSGTDFLLGRPMKPSWRFST